MNMAPTHVRRPVDPSPDARRRPKSAPRPSLKVVPAPQRRKLRYRLVAGIAAGLIAPFALVLVHVELTAGALRLTSLQSSGDAAQTRFEKLRLQVAQLESPARVVAGAQQLGMVTPTTITYLNPTVAARGAGAAPATNGPGVGDWAAAKRVDTGR